MYIATSTVKSKNKTHTCTLLTQSYRDDNGIPRRKTLLNLSSWDKDKVEALRLLLKGEVLPPIDQLTTQSGKAIGAIHLFYQLAKELGITQVIEDKSVVGLSLLLIIGRILTQGSRRHLLDWCQTEEVSEVFGVDPNTLSTDTLYSTLDYLSDHQEELEQALFQFRCQSTQTTPRIYLYDVTSSYLEGDQNELSAWGYNRDKKQGKKQVVIGLMTDDHGYPLAIRVFQGNTLDPQTVPDQITKLAKSFGVSDVTFVGDKGMIKTTTIADLQVMGFHYITTITKPQIRTLLNDGYLQLSLFDSAIGEVIDTKTQVRYIYRKNPVRAAEIEKSRQSRICRIQRMVDKANQYLTDHPKAKPNTYLNRVTEAVTHTAGGFMTVKVQDRQLVVEIDPNQLEKDRLLDGCFVIKTDLDKEVSAQMIHDRYKDLKHVESAFKTIKTGCLEIRPIYVRKASRTRGHVFVSMLAYLLVHDFRLRTKGIVKTLGHKIDVLDKLQTINLTINQQTIKRVPTPPTIVNEIYAACKIPVPIFCS